MLHEGVSEIPRHTGAYRRRMSHPRTVSLRPRFRPQAWTAAGHLKVHARSNSADGSAARTQLRVGLGRAPLATDFKTTDYFLMFFLRDRPDGSGAPCRTRTCDLLVRRAKKGVDTAAGDRCPSFLLGILQFGATAGNHEPLPIASHLSVNAELVAKRSIITT
jgi:hypothetical protein